MNSKKRRTLLPTLSAALLITFHRGAATAGEHFPTKDPRKLKSRQAVAFLFHDGRRAHLVTKLSLASTTPFPSPIAWVIPLPTLPQSYSTMRATVFEELAAETKETNPTVPASSPIKAHPPVVLESYEIFPIEVVEENAGEELNRWLTANGFSPAPKEMYDAYTGPGSVFLVVKCSPPPTPAIELKPLHIVYSADELSFPVSVFGDDNPLDLQVYFFTKKPIPKYLKLRWEAKRFTSGPDLPFRPAEGHEELRKLTGATEGYLTKFSTEASRPKEGEKNFAASLREDPYIPVDLE